MRGYPLDSGSGTKQVLGAGGRAKGYSPPPGRSRGAPSRRAAGPWGPGPIWSRVSEVLSWTSSVSESVAKRPKSMCTKVSIHSSLSHPILYLISAVHLRQGPTHSDTVWFDVPLSILAHQASGPGVRCMWSHLRGYQRVAPLTTGATAV